MHVKSLICVKHGARNRMGKEIIIEKYKAWSLPKFTTESKNYLCSASDLLIKYTWHSFFNLFWKINNSFIHLMAPNIVEWKRTGPKSFKSFMKSSPQHRIPILEEIHGSCPLFKQPWQIRKIQHPLRQPREVAQPQPPALCIWHFTFSKRELICYKPPLRWPPAPSPSGLWTICVHKSWCASFPEAK